ncbi:hypothetical protein C1646_90918 [Rhizophagus diaphanus]|nr:hypothetical protein C1646_90918 [Rhizophagus diaphanus] [Rhizophagus sp. MUCL 43196]
MSDDITNMHITNNWVEAAISKKYIKYYEFKDFQNIEKIGNNPGKVYRAKWKNLKQYFVLKSFDLDNTFVKGIIQELEFNVHNNIILSFGITNKESHSCQLNEYLLVMEYADDNWEDKDFQKNINFNLLYGELSQFIQKFNKINMKQIEPTIQDISENIFEEDLSIIVDELINEYVKELNIGREVNARKKFVLDYLNDHLINLQELYYWLLNNQINSNSIFLLGYFNYHGIGIIANKQNAFKFYQKAIESDHVVAQYYLIYMYMIGKDVDKNYDEAFELSKRLSGRKCPCGINMLAYCYEYGFGTDVDEQKSFKLFQKAADLGNAIGINRLGRCYENGIGTEVNELKAFKLYQEATDLGNVEGMNNLGCCYEKGIGVDVNNKKAFELYQKAANLENIIAQYNLALIYEYGKGIEKNMSKAIYWYKISAKRGYLNAQNKLKELLK